jgi:hypothetical protein
LALTNVLPDDANYRYYLDSEYVKIGYIKTAFGYPVMALPQVADWNSPWGRVISDNYIWILAPSSQKILKLVLEGSTMTNTDSVFQNANLIQKATMYKSWGVGICTNTTSATIAL